MLTIHAAPVIYKHTVYTVPPGTGLDLVGTPPPFPPHFSVDNFETLNLRQQSKSSLSRPPNWRGVRRRRLELNYISAGLALGSLAGDA